MRDWANHLLNHTLGSWVHEDGGTPRLAALPLPYRVSIERKRWTRIPLHMSPRSENRNELPHVRDGRRRELRELLVSAANAANAARTTRQTDDARDEQPNRHAVRDRMTAFFAAAR
jgi:hypothetical protein